MASKESQIAAAITGLTVVLFVALLVVPAINEWRSRRALAEFEAKTAATLEQASMEIRRGQLEESERQRRHSQFAAAEREGKRLGPSQRCIAGSVVRVTQRDGVQAFEQVLENGRTVRCAGRSRL